MSFIFFYFSDLSNSDPPQFSVPHPEIFAHTTNFSNHPC